MCCKIKKKFARGGEYANCQRFCIYTQFLFWSPVKKKEKGKREKWETTMTIEFHLNVLFIVIKQENDNYRSATDAKKIYSNS